MSLSKPASKPSKPLVSQQKSLFSKKTYVIFKFPLKSLNFHFSLVMLLLSQRDQEPQWNLLLLWANQRFRWRCSLFEAFLSESPIEKPSLYHRTGPRHSQRGNLKFLWIFRTIWQNKKAGCQQNQDSEAKWNLFSLCYLYQWEGSCPCHLCTIN